MPTYTLSILNKVFIIGNVIRAPELFAFNFWIHYEEKEASTAVAFDAIFDDFNIRI